MEGTQAPDGAVQMQLGSFPAEANKNALCCKGTCFNPGDFLRLSSIKHELTALESLTSRETSQRLD